ncbi:hypothetical protein JX265_005149 [Neoarthrinium moseri]|uniref:Uncharacterized protein n=1 Tax=Neoarthrinium moseri TaxID=1658444 RepID=A0A9P9WPC1_9PEZI|nr:hypothetical protein JX265_005149 [Neoarthrinium moseri]
MEDDKPRTPQFVGVVGVAFLLIAVILAVAVGTRRFFARRTPESRENQDIENWRHDEAAAPLLQEQAATAFPPADPNDLRSVEYGTVEGQQLRSPQLGESASEDPLIHDHEDDVLQEPDDPSVYRAKVSPDIKSDASGAADEEAERRQKRRTSGSSSSSSNNSGKVASHSVQVLALAETSGRTQGWDNSHVNNPDANAGADNGHESAGHGGGSHGDKERSGNASGSPAAESSSSSSDSS